MKLKWNSNSWHLLCHPQSGLQAIRSGSLLTRHAPVILTSVPCSTPEKLTPVPARVAPGLPTLRSSSPVQSQFECGLSWVVDTTYCPPPLCPSVAVMRLFSLVTTHLSIRLSAVCPHPRRKAPTPPQCPAPAGHTRYVTHGLLRHEDTLSKCSPICNQSRKISHACFWSLKL